jgi:hypothetical protein
MVCETDGARTVVARGRWIETTLTGKVRCAFCNLTRALQTILVNCDVCRRGQTAVRLQYQPRTLCVPA